MTPSEFNSDMERILALNDGKMTEEEAKIYFGDDFPEAAGAAVAIKHIDASAKALEELLQLDF